MEEITPSSDPLMGENWKISALLTMGVDTSGTYEKLIIDDIMFRTNYFTSTDGVTWNTIGRTSQSISKSTVTVGGTTYAAWKHHFPGSADRYYYRIPDMGESGVTALPNNVYEGLIALDIGAVGNEVRYSYTLYGTAVGQPSTRLNTIELHSGHSTSVKEAEIEFAWIDDDTFDNAGKLEKVQAYRTDNGWTSRTEFKRVEYRYKADGDGLTDALGTEGDLIETRSFTRVDNSDTNEDTWKQSVHQYRYHGGEANEGGASPPDPDGDGFIEDGNDHQMKMWFRPEQIEFYAEEHSQSAGSGVVSAVDGAAELLQLDDGAAWFSGSPSIAADLASKVFTQFELTGEGRILEFYQQTDCGCGGGARTARGSSTTTSRSRPH